MVAGVIVPAVVVVGGAGGVVAGTVDLVGALVAGEWSSCG